MNRPALHLIVAMGRDRCIGKAGALPWRLPEDLRRFKALTTGHAIIMGRKTWDSIGRPLPNRRNLVVTRTQPVLPEGVEQYASVEAAIEAARRTDPEPFVIGGATIYEQTLPLATHLHLTFVDVEVDGGDAYFPLFDEESFEEVSREPARREPPEAPGAEFVLLRRR